MDIQRQMIKTQFIDNHCYVHARGLLLPSGFGLITMQRLELTGCDVFYGMEMMKTSDGGKSFSAPVACRNLTRRYHSDGTSIAMCDATPFYHRSSGRILLTGHTAVYGANNKVLRSPRPRSTAYAVYNSETGDFSAYKILEMPDNESGRFFSSGAGCSQILELPSGELLIPIYYQSYEQACDPNTCSSVCVARCSFDGENIRVVEMGNALTVDIPRGFSEPSIVKYGNHFFLVLRNDQSGFVSVSHDGLHFEKPRELCFDNGENLGNYNTQQHWLTGGGKLWLVYTRRTGNNDHVFRHRAPLFLGEFDPHRLCVIHSTERIVVPERGARLGNFGCQSYSDAEGYVFAAEWMQNDPLGWDACAKYGSDNSIFVSKVIF